jgi:hypothetical protein
MMSGTQGGGPRRAGPVTVAKAVLWSFLGIRRGRDHETDMARITPAQAIVAGLIGAAIFVAVLVGVVRLVISSAAS